MKQGDVYWVSLNPTVGSETQGKGSEGSRPCVILSPDILNDNLNTVIIAPCTSQLRGHPYTPQINSTSKKSEVRLDQIRAVDKSRLINKMCTLTKAELKKCLDILNVIFKY